MIDRLAVSVRSSDMTKSRKPHPIVQVAQIAASELNDLLNAIGLRISLLRNQLAASAYEAEMVRLAGLVEKASQRVQRLEEYARAEELVASTRPGRPQKRTNTPRPNNPAIVSEPGPRSALLIADSCVENSAIKECLERSGCAVVVAESSADGLKLLQANDHFDHIVCDSVILAEAGSSFTAELSRAARASRVYVLQRNRLPERPLEHRE
jgi:PleD family two-component response regulator